MMHPLAPERSRLATSRGVQTAMQRSQGALLLFGALALSVMSQDVPTLGGKWVFDRNVETIFEGQSIATRSCVSVDFSAGLDNFQLVSSELSFNYDRINRWTSQRNSRTVSLADNSTMWAGWVNVTVLPASYETNTYSRPQAFQPGNDALVCAYLRIVDEGRSVMVAVRTDGTCPADMRSMSLLHLTTDTARACLDARNSPLYITSRANLTDPQGLFGGHFVSVDDVPEGSRNRGCRQLDFGTRQTSGNPGGRISGSLAYRQRYVLGSGQKVQQNYSMEFETATAVVLPSPSSSSTPAPTTSASPTSNVTSSPSPTASTTPGTSSSATPSVSPTPSPSSEVAEPWAGWTRVTGPISVSTLQAGNSEPSTAESFQGCAYLFFDSSKQEITAQLNPDPRKTCMESPTEGRSDTDRFVGYRESPAVQCMEDGRAPGARGPQGPSAGDTPGTTLSASVQGYFKGVGGGGVDCLGVDVFSTSLRIYRQLSTRNATEDSYFISTAQNVTEGAWKDWIKFQAIEHREYFTIEGEAVDQGSQLTCGYIKEEDFAGGKTLLMILGSQENSGASTPDGCPSDAARDAGATQVFVQSTVSNKCTREPTGPPSPGTVEEEFWGVFGGETLNFTSQVLPTGSSGCIEINVDPEDAGSTLSVASRIVDPSNGVQPLQEELDRVIGAGEITSGPYAGWYRVISLVEVPPEERDSEGQPTQSRKCVLIRRTGADGSGPAMFMSTNATQVREAGLALDLDLAAPCPDQLPMEYRTIYELDGGEVSCPFQFRDGEFATANIPFELLGVYQRRPDVGDCIDIAVRGQAVWNSIRPDTSNLQEIEEQMINMTALLTMEPGAGSTSSRLRLFGSLWQFRRNNAGQTQLIEDGTTCLEFQRVSGSNGFRLEMRKGEIDPGTGTCSILPQLYLVPQSADEQPLCDSGSPYLRDVGGGISGALAPSPSPSVSPTPSVTPSVSPSFGSSPSPSAAGNGTGGGDKGGGGSGGIIAAVIVVVLLLGGVGGAYYWFAIMKQPVPGFLEPCFGSKSKGISSYKGPNATEETIQNPMTGAGQNGAGAPVGPAVGYPGADLAAANGANLSQPPAGGGAGAAPQPLTAGGPGFAAPIGGGGPAMGVGSPPGGQPAGFTNYNP